MIRDTFFSLHRFERMPQRDGGELEDLYTPLGDGLRNVGHSLCLEWILSVSQ